MATPKTQSAYQTYLADPDMRGRIDREVVRLRAEAVRKFILVPIAGRVRGIAAIAEAALATIKPLNWR